MLAVNAIPVRTAAGCARWLTARMAAHIHIAVIEGLLVLASIYLIVSALRA